MPCPPLRACAAFCLTAALALPPPPALAGDLDAEVRTPEGVGPVLPGDRLAGQVEGVGSISLTFGPAA